MAVSGIQGLPLEVTVVGCTNLKDKEWISRQDPYVCLEYGSNRFRTKTCTDGGKNPSFQEKFVVSLIEGLRELNVGVWNSNTLSIDDFIGSGRIQLHKVLSQGYDDSSWSVQDKCGRYSGEVRVILHYSYGNLSKNKISPSAPPATSGAVATYPSALPAAYPTYPAASPYPGYPPKPVAPACPPPPYSAYPPTAAAIPYPPNTMCLPSTYPPPPSGYLTSTYPPPPVMYPPQYPPPPTACYPPPPGSVYPPPPY